MLLFDIGNTTISMYDRGGIKKVNNNDTSLFPTDEPFFYISVNSQTNAYLNMYQNGIDLQPFLKLDTSYYELGVDRVAACNAISDGVIVDAGSAITIDIMSNDTHLGGYILPGINAQKEAYKSISDSLKPSIDTTCDEIVIPQSTKEAINCGLIMPIIEMIKSVKKSNKIYFTGGDGAYFSRFFDNSIYDATLVFKGMLKAIEENSLKERYLC